MMKYVGARLTVVAALVGIGVACGPVSADVKDGDNPAKVDADGDGIKDADDNCVDVPNTDQTDVDADKIGDACDSLVDSDDDGVGDDVDNCVAVDNAEQADLDMDGVGDVCDNCPGDSNVDQVDENGDGIGDACPCDICGPADWCMVHPTQDAVCGDFCPTERQADDQRCCPAGSKAENGACPLPDLYVDVGRLESSLRIDSKNFNTGSCEYVEGCVQGTGNRTLLRFDTTTPNQGAGDLHLGDPGEFENFVWSPCHQHYHFESYAAYEVQDAQGNVLAPGHKQAFCLMDFERWGGGQGNGYNCGYQGISTGWADTYSAYLDCQFVDITDLGPGEYNLQVHVNHAEVIAEEDYANNITSVDLQLLDSNGDGEVDGVDPL